MSDRSTLKSPCNGQSGCGPPSETPTAFSIAIGNGTRKLVRPPSREDSTGQSAPVPNKIASPRSSNPGGKVDPTRRNGSNVTAGMRFADNSVAIKVRRSTDVGLSTPSKLATPRSPNSALSATLRTERTTFHKFNYVARNFRQ